MKRSKTNKNDLWWTYAEKSFKDRKLTKGNIWWNHYGLISEDEQVVLNVRSAFEDSSGLLMYFLSQPLLLMKCNFLLDVEKK